MREEWRRQRQVDGIRVDLTPLTRTVRPLTAAMQPNTVRLRKASGGKR